jgi:multidrug transporter EmrE-like cation transporter
MGPLLKRGLWAVVAFFSWRHHAGQCWTRWAGAALRETSTVFAALIGWLVLGEKVGPVRTGLMALIAGGAVMIEALG